ncbi:MAG: adenylate cyclase [Lachnospiraceae bacterium]|nr:adenylate cyclase [Lachnospiraceae bacterium]
MGVEIEKKFLVKCLPKDLDKYPYHVIEQGYLNVFPAIRVRHEDDVYYMTYKGDIENSSTHVNPTEHSADGSCKDGNRANDAAGKIGKTEYNMPLDKASYEHMVSKADGNMIRKLRYLIPLNMDAYTIEYLDKRPEIARMMENGDIKIELDVFDDPFKGNILAEVEFPDEDAAGNYIPPQWFGEEVTGNHRYSNAYMSTVRL